MSVAKARLQGLVAWSGVDVPQLKEHYAQPLLSTFPIHLFVFSNLLLGQIQFNASAKRDWTHALHCDNLLSSPLSFGNL